jgi:hypothetical protein
MKQLLFNGSLPSSVASSLPAKPESAVNDGNAENIAGGIADNSSVYSGDFGAVTDTNNIGFNNLICPLCLKFLCKCTTTACGHSFCERCIDEFLIIRKVSIFIQSKLMLLRTVLYVKK